MKVKIDTLNRRNLINFKPFLLVFLLLVSSNRLNAKTGKNIFGVIAGTNLSCISDYKGEPLISFSGGLYWDWKFSKRFSFQSDILYSRRGEYKGKIVSELKLHYLNMPMMLKFYATDKFQILIGIYWDYLLGVENDIYSKEEFKTSDWGLPIGFRYKIYNNFQLGLTYNIGFTEISDFDNGSDIYRNNWVNIAVAYIFKKRDKN